MHERGEKEKDSLTRLTISCKSNEGVKSALTLMEKTMGSPIVAVGRYIWTGSNE